MFAIRGVVLVGLLLAPAAAQGAGVVKVFLLAGQSNMEGKAPNALFDHQATASATREQFAHLRAGDAWEVRDDVSIRFLDRHGPLTIGYGSPGRTGVEFEFGHMMGEHFAEPVLLIKAAWGGHSLCKDFRPPSAGLPAEEVLAKELAQAQERVRKDNEKSHGDAPLPTRADIEKPYGDSYRNMLQEVATTRKQLATLFPGLAGKTFELAGFVWFQGWNDQYGGQGEYESNLEHLVHDLRPDVEADPMVAKHTDHLEGKPMGHVQEGQHSLAAGARCAAGSSAQAEPAAGPRTPVPFLPERK